VIVSKLTVSCCFCFQEVRCVISKVKAKKQDSTLPLVLLNETLVATYFKSMCLIVLLKS